MARRVEGYFPLPCVALTDAAASFCAVCIRFVVETVACYYHYTEGYMACEVVAAEIAAVVEIVDSSACQDVVGFVVVVVVVVAAFSAFVVVIATAVVVAAAVVVVMDRYCLNWPGSYYVVDSDLVVEFFVL